MILEYILSLVKNSYEEKSGSVISTNASQHYNPMSVNW